MGLRITFFSTQPAPLTRTTYYLRITLIVHGADSPLISLAHNL
jgi:hypothetical protein